MQIIIRNARPGEGETLALIEAACFPAAEAASAGGHKRAPERISGEVFCSGNRGKSSGICKRRRDRRTSSAG